MIPLVETGGTPYDIGFDVGKAVRDQIRTAAASSRAEFARVDDSRVTDRITEFVVATERAAPELIEELRGMAEGSGVSFAELFVMNASTELHQTAGRFEECTVVGVTEHGTVDGNVLLAHNEDATAGWGELAYVIHAKPENAPEFAAFTYAGLLLHQGVNSAGLGSVGNALYVRDAKVGIPKLLLYRRAIAQPTIEQAIRAVTTPGRAYGNNHLFANADGDIYDVEVTGAAWSLLHAGNRFLAHANHLVDPCIVHLDREEDLLNSQLRVRRVERLVDAQFGAITVDSLKAIMADHANYPRSVCKHHAPESDLFYGTIGSVVIDVTNRILWACSGNPCRGDWREVRIASVGAPAL
jgi:isopenicillin-N N-acyltransferase-like protein